MGAEGEWAPGGEGLAGHWSLIGYLLILRCKGQGSPPIPLPQAREPGCGLELCSHSELSSCPSCTAQNDFPFPAHPLAPLQALRMPPQPDTQVQLAETS